MLAAYARFIVRNSYLVMFIVGIISTTLTLIPLVCHQLPSFSDPIIGFETRGTSLAHRFISWENLIDETRPSRRLAVNPKEIEDQIRMNLSYHNIVNHNIRFGNGRKKERKNKKIRNNSTKFAKTSYKSSDLKVTQNHVHWSFGKNVSFEDEETAFLRNHTWRQWKSLKEMQLIPLNFTQHNYASGICGAPMSDYAHLVVSSLDGASLLNYENIMEICELQSMLVQVGSTAYTKICQRSSLSEELCCPIWSVPNYISILSGKRTCNDITKKDVSATVELLIKCAGYFHNFTLMASCGMNRCRVPKYCTQHDAIYHLLFYLIDSDAFSPQNISNSFVRSMMLFLPLPASSTILPFYNRLQSTNLTYGNIFVPAMQLGLKNALFDLWVIRDTWLMGVGGVFVFLCVWIYTKSLLLTILLFAAIIYSLGVAYFLYVYVFLLEFFPFMNLLVVVVVIGIGADDAFLYCKVWKMISKRLMKDNIIAQENGFTDLKNVSSAGETILVQIVEETLRHSVTAIFVTTLTTSVAFFASYVSYIPAINCFSIFAGTSVLVNFLFMVSWLPASVFLIDVKVCVSRNGIFDVFNKFINNVGEDIRLVVNRLITASIMRLHVVLAIFLGSIGLISVIIVFYYPGLQLPNTKQFQLFQKTHPFEQYDHEYSQHYLFEKFTRDTGMVITMPLRWIWGIKAIDNGSHMDPSSRGKLMFDEHFNISDPKSQVWLSNFCSDLKIQNFYQHTGPLLPNCFIESFKMYMSRQCYDVIDKLNRTPCCESSHFPYSKDVFDYCIIKAMESLYQTPREIFMPGIAGPKFLRSSRPPTVAAIVVEFESNVPYSMSYKDMNDFFINVENWTQHTLKFAPEGMKNGWFISDLQFYDLQKTLASGTVMALLLSAALGFIVLLPSTFSFVVSLCALIAMIFSATVTIATLVLIGWKLNVLESVSISLSAGLAVDFSLHYALSYTNANGTKAARVKYALCASSGPTAAAALTTGCSGIFLLFSNLLPYSQIGLFLFLIMLISWFYATFFLCSMLHVFGSNTTKETLVEEKKAESKVSSICSDVPDLESHELEHLAESNRTNITTSHSPSNISATTVVLHEDFEKKIEDTTHD
ncbi:protein dispatched [Leptidea sinapis]|uniref:protein dispatched n=1 Tax=Leptidea sinapis TaxID=189913 RepID=UPI0021237B2C|nr:protein dispatched [Leptidea sinapis]